MGATNTSHGFESNAQHDYRLLRSKLCRRSGLIALVFTMALALTPHSLSAAAYVPVYGGPTDAHDIFYYTDGLVTEAGTVVGWIGRTNALGLSIGVRAVRWDASGAATELGNLGIATDGHSNCYLNALNGTGTAAGYAEKYNASGTPFGERAVRWSATGTAITELGNLGTDLAGFAIDRAIAINAAGTTVGQAGRYDASGTYLGVRPVRWSAGSNAATELAHLGTDVGGVTNSYPYALNNSGMAVGYSEKNSASGASLGGRAVRWSATGTAATELGNLGTNPDGSTTGEAFDINAAGTAVGDMAKIGGPTTDFGIRAVRWNASGTAATELGSLGTTSWGFTRSYASYINDAGTVIGWANKYNAIDMSLGVRAVRWDAMGTVATELGNLGTDADGVTHTGAADINVAGTIVGSAYLYTAAGTLLGERATLWNANAAVVDLNTFIDPASGWVLISASDVSDTNWVTGLGAFDPDGAGGEPAYARTFLLQVPEPTSLVVVATVICLSPRRCRRCQLRAR